MKNTDDNGNKPQKQAKKAKKPQKNRDGIKILTFLKLSQINYKSRLIINRFFLNEIISVLEKKFDWQKEKENQENFDKLKLELKTKESQGKILDDQWTKIKDFLENLWLKND